MTMAAQVGSLGQIFVRGVLAVSIMSVAGCGSLKWVGGPQDLPASVSAEGRQVENRTFSIDGGSPSQYLRVDPARDHMLEVHADIPDPDFAWGAAPLSIGWTGNIAIESRVRPAALALDIIFTAGLGVLVDVATGGLYYYPDEYGVNVELVPSADANARRRAYVERELEVAATRERERDVVAASRILENAAAASEKHGFQDLASRAREGVNRLAPSLETVRGNERRLAALLGDGTLVIGTNGQETCFTEFQGGRPVVHYEDDTGLDGRPRYVQFNLAYCFVVADLDGASVSLRAIHDSRALQIVQDIVGRLDTQTGQFRGRMRTSVATSGGMRDDTLEVVGRVIPDKPRQRNR